MPARAAAGVRSEGADEVVAVSCFILVITKTVKPTRPRPLEHIDTALYFAGLVKLIYLLYIYIYIMYILKIYVLVSLKELCYLLHIIIVRFKLKTPNL